MAQTTEKLGSSENVYESSVASKRPVVSQVGGHEVIISSNGRILIDKKEVTGADKFAELFGSDLVGDEESSNQWGWTKKLVGEVFNFVLRSDTRTIAALRSGEIKIEDVLSRSVGVVGQMLELQLKYEDGRSKVGHLDVDQAAGEAIERVLKDSAHSWFNWASVPEEMKKVIIGLLEDYRRNQAVAAAAALSPEQVRLGLANLADMHQAKLNARMNGLERKEALVATKALNLRTDLEERNRIKAEKDAAVVANRNAQMMGVVDAAASASSRTFTGIGDVLRHYGVQATAYVFDQKDGLLPMGATGIKEVLNRLKEPTVWSGATGMSLGIIGGSLVITSIGITGPISVIVLTGLGVAGAGFGAKVPDAINRGLSNVASRLTGRG